jgi:predicted dinucleotide-binding enzyme
MKIGIVGAGHIGGTAAYLFARRETSLFEGIGFTPVDTGSLRVGGRLQATRLAGLRPPHDRASGR